eukprot:5364878-Prorocentrum_lima.AAC.1
MPPVGAMGLAIASSQASDQPTPLVLALLEVRLAKQNHHRLLFLPFLQLLHPLDSEEKGYQGLRPP